MMRKRPPPPNLRKNKRKEHLAFTLRSNPGCAPVRGPLREVFRFEYNKLRLPLHRLKHGQAQIPLDVMLNDAGRVLGFGQI